VCDIESLDLWSSWLEPELARSDTTEHKLVAYSAHLERMQALAKGIAVRAESGAKGGTSDNLDAAHYVAEAEMWIAKARSTAKTS